MAWLQAQVQPSGQVSDSPAASVQQTRCETAATLLKLAGGNAQVAALVAALQADSGADIPTETLACAQQLRQQLGQTLLNPEVQLRRVGQQGYGAYQWFNAANALDTGWALGAQLQNLSAQDKAVVIGWLQTSQAADGSFAVGGAPDLRATAVVVRALKDESSTNPVAAALAAKAAQYLLGKQSAQGAWLDDVATTAAVYEAVQPYTAANPGVGSAVQTYLLARQQADGSWAGDPYASALALRALALAASVPLDPTRAGLSVKFVDARSAIGVAGVQLSASGPQSLSGLADASGAVLVQGVLPGSYQFSASVAGYATVTFSATLQAGKVLDLGTLQLLVPGSASTAVLSGTVRDGTTGSPLAGASVQITGQSLSALSGNDGNYLISGVAPGAISFTASKTGYLSAAGSAQASAGQVTNFSPRLQPGSASGAGCSIAGTVRDALSGQPVAGVAITLSGASSASATTDASGSYTLAASAAGAITLMAAKSGYDSVSAATQLVCSNLRPTLLDFSPRLYPAGQSPVNANTSGLSGTVVDAGTNQPIAGAQLALTPAAGSPLTMASQADGRFSFTGLSGASAQLQVQASGYQGVTLQYALTPLQTTDLGQIRLRAPKVAQLLPDLKVVAVQRGTAVTDAQTLQLSGAVQVQLANVGAQSAPAGVQLLAFSDVNRNGVYDPGIDTVLGQASYDASLAPGQTATVQISVAGTLPFRDAPISVVADPNNQIAEISKTNNVNSTAQQAMLVPNVAAFKPVLKWQWDGSTSPYPNYNQVMMAPVAGRLLDTNGDGRVDAQDTPVVVFTTYASYLPSGYSGYNKDGVIRVVNGSTGAELLAIKDPTVAVGAVSNLVLADLDGDGKPEIVAVTLEGGLVVFRNDGTKWWSTPPLHPFNWWPGFCPCSSWGAPLVADLDGDGKPEVIFGRYVYSFDGVLKWVANTPYIGGYSYYGLPESPMAVAADLDLSGKQSLIIGPSVHSSDGRLLWSNSNVPDGFVAIGNFNSDPYPEIVISGGGKLSLLSHTGELIWQVSIPGAYAGFTFGGPPTIADVDGDGIPEIGVANGSYYTVFRADGSVLWSVPSQDGSAMTGSTVFDFGGDGHPQVLYGDELSIRALSGSDGTVTWSLANSSATTHEYPLVVDVDGSGHAALVTIANEYPLPNQTIRTHGIRVFRDVNNSWVPTRSIWNQHAYSITNINDDLSVPSHPVPSWQAYNTFRANRRTDGDPRALADLSAGYVRVQDNGAAQAAGATVRIGNAGAYQAPATVKVALYGAAAGGANQLLGTTALGSALLPGQYVDLSLPVTSLGSYATLTFVADDDGTGLHAIADFDRTNNTVSANLSGLAINEQVAVGVGKPSYTDAEQAVFTAVVTNAGSFTQAAQVRFTVLDGAGQVVQVLPLPAGVSVAAGASATSTVSWPAGGVLAGSYAVKAELLSPTGLVYGSASAGFAVTASQAQADAARIITDRVSYSAAQLVQLSSRVANQTANTVQANLQALTVVTGAGGQTVFSRSEPIAQLAPGGQRQYGYSLPAGGLAAGGYTATVKLLDAGGATLAQGTSSFTVLGSDQSGVGLTGALQAPASVLIGQGVALSLNATNGGNADLAAVPVSVHVIDPPTGAVLASLTQTLSAWPHGTSQALAFNWTAAGLDGQTVVAAATVQIGGKDIPLGQAVIRLVGVPRLQASPAQLAFGPLYVGESAPAAPVTVSSVGTAAARTVTVALSGLDASQFVIPAASAAGGCAGPTSQPVTLPITLPIGATCTFAVSYQPSAGGLHSGQAKVSYAGAPDLLVQLTGQAKPLIFTGSVAADAAEVQAGDSVGLSYSVSNPAGVTSTLAGQLSVLDPTGQSLSSWPLALSVGAAASYAGHQSYTTPTDPQTLTAVLSQLPSVATGVSSTVVLATGTFTVIDPPVPLGVSAGIKGQARILVLLSCPPGLSAQDDAACLAQRSQAIDTYLSGLGLMHKIVTTGQAFVDQLRCGPYNTYWLSGGAVKLSEQAAEELREAVYRGQALWMDGVHDARNQLLHPVAGVKQVGKLPQSNQTAALQPAGLYGAGSLPTLGQITKFELAGGQAQALFTQVPGQQGPVPAVVSNQWGQGDSLLWAFDLAAMLTADPGQLSQPLREFVTASASWAAGTTATLTIGDLTLLDLSVTNQGTRTAVLSVQASLPAGLTSTVASPAAQLSSQPDGSTLARWNFTLAGGATQELTWLVKAVQSGSYSVPYRVYSLPRVGSTAAPRLRQSGSIEVQVQDAQVLLGQAQQAVNALQPVASSDQQKLAKAQAAVSQALALHAQASYEQAIAQWLAAADALQSLSNAGAPAVQAAQLAVALALEASTDALCIQKCGSASCQTGQAGQ